MHIRTWRLLIAALGLAGFAATASAQQTTGTITGRVLDEQKAAVPGANLAFAARQRHVDLLATRKPQLEHAERATNRVDPPESR